MFLNTDRPTPAAFLDCNHSGGDRVTLCSVCNSMRLVLQVIILKNVKFVGKIGPKMNAISGSLIRDFNQEIKPRAALQVINWRVAVQMEIVTAFTTLMQP